MFSPLSNAPPQGEARIQNTRGGRLERKTFGEKQNTGIKPPAPFGGSVGRVEDTSTGQSAPKIKATN